MLNYETILVEPEKTNVVTVTLNRPHKKTP